MSLLVISEILGLFLNTVTANDKYSLHNREKLQEPIQMLLWNKQKTFSAFFAPFLKSTSNLEHFERKDDPHSLSILEITDCKRSV